MKNNDTRNVIIGMSMVSIMFGLMISNIGRSENKGTEINLKEFEEIEKYTIGKFGKLTKYTLEDNSVCVIYENTASETRNMECNLRW